MNALLEEEIGWRYFCGEHAGEFANAHVPARQLLYITG
jgi:hypothetical protein